MATDLLGVERDLASSKRLSSDSIRRLCSSPLGREQVYLLWQALQHGEDPDPLLLQLVNAAQGPEYLVPLALLLRQKANPNMYINMPKIGTIHLLGYLYLLKGREGEEEEPVLRGMVLLLLLRGARPVLPIFDPLAGQHTPSWRGRSSSVTVLDWLKQQGYDSLLLKVNYADLARHIGVEELQTLYLLLSLQPLPRPLSPEDHTLLIRSFSPWYQSRALNEEQGNPLEESTYTSEELLAESVFCFNGTSYRYYCSRGQPTYLMVNTLVLSLKLYQEHPLCAPELAAMLDGNVGKGVELDIHQWDIVRSLPPSLRDELEKSYSRPYWLKACSQDSHPLLPTETEISSLALLRLAYLLELDCSSHQSLCRGLQRLSQANPSELVRANQQKQRLRLIGCLGYTEEFIGDKIPVLPCRNLTLLEQDPYEHNSLSLAYYRDDQGAVWCFTRDMFPLLIERGTNPHDYAPLPALFLSEVKGKLELARSLGLRDKETLTYSSALELMQEQDKPNDWWDQEELSRFRQLSASYGVASPRPWSKAEVSSLVKVLKPGLDLNMVTLPHSLVILAYLANRSPPEQQRELFSSLRQ